MPSRLGSTQQRSWRNGECRTTEDVGRLFEHYRDEARLFAEMVGDLPQRPAPRPTPREARRRDAGMVFGTGG
jgi:hypothetical protein